MHHRRSVSIRVAKVAALISLISVVPSGCGREIGHEGQRGVPGLPEPLIAAEPPLATPPRPGTNRTDSARDSDASGSSQTREISSVLHSEMDAEIGTRVPGMIASVAVEIGDLARKGQLLATLRDEEELAGLEAATAALELARLEHERATLLHQRNSVTQAELDQATYRFRVAAAAVREAEVRLEYTRIRAPFNGAVTRRFVRVGQSVEAREPIVRVTALRPLRSLLRVSEGEARALKSGQELTLRGLSGEQVEGRISRIAPAVDPLSGTVEVLIEVPDPRGLRPGSTISVQLGPPPSARP
jgi:RND family efflux transporter MFP subunit